MAFKLKDLNPLKATANAQDVLLGAAATAVLVPYVNKFVLEAKFLKKADGTSRLPKFLADNAGAVAALLAGVVAFLGLKRTKMASKAGSYYVGAVAVGAATLATKVLSGVKLPGLSYSDTVAVQLGTLIDERPPALAGYGGTLVDEPGFRQFAAEDDDDGMGQLAALAMEHDEDYADLDALVNIET